ncbi:Flp pilus assembly protein CpaB [Jannaschia pohangensis]|uniref:Pilus assembly protein CpaB n=1 Tax=Jannaschia pohangensis TaxID=390807 RepID=A0A1I3LTL9_9RHOB|nr:Flp pilus assembly protein CpaB [Jannaschia pohangensis]SFI88072.1 pilus assembly protein CpaB [Jannaschia pohangensis]
MRLIFGLLMIVGLGLAGFAIHTAKGRFDQYQSALTETQNAVIPVTDVFVVKRQLKYGDVLQPDDVQAVAWPADHVPAGALRTMDEIFPPGNQGQRTVLRVIERDEPLLATKVTLPGADAGLAAALTPGMRAFTLTVDVRSGVSGFLRPGDRVDVYWTGTGQNGGVTRLIHASLPLIAIDQITDEERNNPTIARTVTVESPPEIIAKLAQAQATGRLTLALVGVNDDTTAAPTEAGIEAIIGERAQPERVEAPKVCVIRTRKGTEFIEEPVDCPTEEG